MYMYLRLHSGLYAVGVVSSVLFSGILRNTSSLHVAQMWSGHFCSSCAAALGRLLVVLRAVLHKDVPLLMSLFSVLCVFDHFSIWCSACLCCAAMGVCGRLCALCLTFAVLLTLYIVNVFELSYYYLVV